MADFLKTGASRSELLAALMDKQQRQYAQQPNPQSWGEAAAGLGSQLVDAVSKKSLVDEELKRRKLIDTADRNAIDTYMSGTPEWQNPDAIAGATPQGDPNFMAQPVYSQDPNNLDANGNPVQLGMGVDPNQSTLVDAVAGFTPESAQIAMGGDNVSNETFGKLAEMRANQEQIRAEQAATPDTFIDIQGGKAIFQTKGGKVEAREIYGITAEELKSTRNVQSSKILPGGVVQITYKDGTIEVKKANGEELEQIIEAEERGVDLAGQTSGSRKTGAAQATRAQTTINIGVDAVKGIPILRRSLQLLETIDTGGIDAFALGARRLFGVEGADEGELSANLGKAVLSRLKETFGAAFTENEGKRLEELSAGFGKSAASNKRLLRQALLIVDGAAKRGLDAATESGDKLAMSEIMDYQDGIYDLTDEQLSAVFKPVERDGSKDTGRVNANGERLFQLPDGQFVARK